MVQLHVSRNSQMVMPPTSLTLLTLTWSCHELSNVCELATAVVTVLFSLYKSYLTARTATILFSFPHTVFFKITHRQTNPRDASLSPPLSNESSLTVVRYHFLFIPLYLKTQ